MGKDCKYCGAYIADIVDVCPACGKKIKAEKAGNVETYESVRGAAAAKAAQQTSKEEREQEENAAYTYKQEYERRYGKYRDPYNPGGDSQDDEDEISPEEADALRNRSICYLCYLGPLFLIPYLTRRDSDFVRFHSNQGLLLLLADVICELCGGFPIVGGIIELVGVLFIVTGLIEGFSNVSKGVKKPLPIIGEIKILDR